MQYKISKFPQTAVVKDILPVGAVIWRCVSRDVPTTPPVYTNNNPGNLTFVRVLLSGKYYGVCEPVVNPYTGPQKPHGVICFLETPLCDGWTHLVVTGHGKNGSACFARPERGDMDNLIEFTKLQQYYSRVASCPEEFMELVANASDGITAQYARRVQCQFIESEYHVLTRNDG